MSKFRSKVHNKGGDKKYFSKTADKSHFKNSLGVPRRGGIRL